MIGEKSWIVYHLLRYFGSIWFIDIILLKGRNIDSMIFTFILEKLIPWDGQ
jgi:hypothetical protein